jgi:hypothetical protein
VVAIKAGWHQAISQKPKLVTMGRSYNDALDRASFRQRRCAVEQTYGYLSILGAPFFFAKAF